MTRLSLATVLILSALLLPSRAMAEDGPLLPSAEQLGGLAATIPKTNEDLARFFEKAHASRCQVAEALVECFDLKSSEITIRRWHTTGLTTTADHVATADVIIEKLQLNESETILEGVAIRDGDSAWIFGRVRLAGGDIFVEHLAHGHVVNEPVFSTIEARTLITSATWLASSGTWSLEHVTNDGVETQSVAAGQSNGGFVPPRARFADEVFEFDASWAGVWHVPWVFTAAAAPTHWYGVGLGVVTGDSPRLLELQVRYDDEDGWLPFVSGALAIHDNDHRSRLGATLEHPATGKHWKLRALEANAWLRPTRLSEMGANASGPQHALSLNAGLSTPLDGFVTPDFWDVGARYGTTLSLSNFELDLDLDERTRLRGEDEQAHSTTGVLAIRTPFGRAGRGFLTPGVTLVSNFGVLPEDLGFEASASGQLILGLDGQLAFAGRFESLTHHIVGRASLRREIFGFSQRPLIAPNATSFFLYTRVEDWTMGTVMIDQALESAHWRFGFPAGVVINGSGLEDAVDHISAFVRLEFDHNDTFSLSTTLSCRPGDCGDLAAASNVALRSRFLELSISHDRSSADEIMLAELLPRIRSGRTLAKLTQPVQAIEIEDSFVATATLSFRDAWRWDVSGFLRTESDIDGVRSGIRYDARGLGMDFTLDGAYLPSRDEWLGFAGFVVR